MDSVDCTGSVRVAAIDIGTNTILLLIADVDADGRIRIVSTAERIARLGEGIHPYKIITEGAKQRACNILASFCSMAELAKADRYCVTGTSIFRDASNRVEFIAQVQEQFGLRIRVLTGEEESRLTYQGVLSDPALPVHERYAVLDIGGGSTEVSLGSRSNIEISSSIDIGCVRSTHRFFPSLPPGNGELSAFAEFVSKEVCSFPRFDTRNTLFIGVAGTVYTLARLKSMLDLSAFEPQGQFLSLQDVENMYRYLACLTVPEILALKVVPQGRADIILAGAGILFHTMDHLSVKEIMVSERGLRYGLAVQEALRPSSA
jgi:exopolyphosphatase / guanosine-5'-triphosphate,3'-diphosphate pyrophosphatase